ncbi:hypothetical protein [uncultured Mycolicibacterium sp.]|uniref:hypothetical protein n=1 Tax=uncultured Mycolicibacterium sp. TaxID=2320817 RepID=UPI0032B17B7A|tara:strand:+ start:205 stop:510 length:306 start_codon:yes stop_codon:yes gene_type:complete
MMTKTLAIVVSAVVALFGAPAARAECCETEFDWAEPYANALRNHDLGYLIEDRGIMVALAAEAICKGSSAIGISQEYGFGLATSEQIARAMYIDVCPEMAP